MTSHRQTREQLLARFAALDAAEQAARDAAARTLDAALDAICELQVAWALMRATTTPRDAVVAGWASDLLGVELTPGEPIPAGIVAAFASAQALLWAGEPVHPLLLVDDPSVS